MRYFKVFTSFTDFISIEENELEKVLYAFITGKPTVLKNGAISRIDSIVPDWNKAMGWNASYKIGDADWNEIRSKGVEKKYEGVISEYKEKVVFLRDSGQENLIGKNVSREKLGTTKLTLGE